MALIGQGKALQKAEVMGSNREPFVQLGNGLIVFFHEAIEESQTIIDRVDPPFTVFDLQFSVFG